MGDTVQTRLNEVRDRIERAAARSGRSGSDVTLVGVTKTLPAELVLQAVDAGLTRFGENRLQGAPEKMQQVREALGPDMPPLEWHFIGQLQSNKVKPVLESFDWVQSIDRRKLVDRVSRIAGELGVTARVLLQLDITDKDSQGGTPPEQMPDLVRYAGEQPNLRVEGLMAIAPLTENEAELRRSFARVVRTAEQIDKLSLPNVRMETLSMGMSGDYEIAIEEGATLVRVGTAIFGPRRA